MLSKLFKPKWQHKNPVVRMKALESLEGSSAELIAMATSDSSSEVRLHTVQYLLHVPTLKKLSEEPEDRFSVAVKQRVTELVLQQAEIADLEKVYGLIKDVDVHHKVANDSTFSSAIRCQAIVQVDDQDLLFTIANTDAYKQIQYLAASQLTNYSQLKKLRKFTKTNKNLRKLLKEKGAELQKQQNFVDQLNGYCNEIEVLVDQGQDHKRFSEIQQHWQKKSSLSIPATEQERFKAASVAFESAHSAYQQGQKKLKPLRAKAQGILKAEDDLIHALTHSPADFTQQDFAKGVQSIKANWAALDTDALGEERNFLSLTYNEKLSSIEKSVVSLKSDFRAIDQMKDLCKKAERKLSGKQAIHKKTIADFEKQWKLIKRPSAIDFADTQTAFTHTIQQLTMLLKTQDSQLENNLKGLDRLLDKMESSLKAKQFNDAIPAYQNAYRLLDSMQGVDKKNHSRFNRRLRAATPEIRHAKSWLHWGSDTVRGQLLERAQALIVDTKIQPDARAKQVKDLRNEWKKLGKMDPGKHQQLWLEFDAACSKAYEPCQQFYKQESVQRGDNLTARFTICKQLETLEQQTDWKAVDWRAITKKINQLRGQWRGAGNIDRSSWTKANKRFNDALDAVEVHLGKERRHNLLQRQHLITQAQALVETLDKADDIEVVLEQAIQSAKSLQSQWQTTVTGKRADEQKLWNTFRQAIDAVFNRQRKERDLTSEGLTANLKKKQDICHAMNALSELEGGALLANQHKLTEMEHEFNQIYELPRNSQRSIEQQFVQSKKAVHEKIQHGKKAQQISQLLLLSEKSTLCAKKWLDDHADVIKSQWDELATLHNEKLEVAMQQHFNHPSFSDQEKLDNTGESQRLLLELEILLALDTPEAYQQERMKFQVERLSEQMSTASEMHQSEEDKALQKIQDWYLVGAVRDDQQITINKRFEKVEVWLKSKLSQLGT